MPKTTAQTCRFECRYCLTEQNSPRLFLTEEARDVHEAVCAVEWEIWAYRQDEEAHPDA